MNRAPAYRRYVILGSGVAGIAAAEAIRAADDSGEIAVVSEDPAGYYSRPGLAYYLTGELPEDMLFPMGKKDLRALNLRWYTARAERILPGEQQVELANHRVLPYDRLLIATGSLASPLNTPGGQLEGVYKLDHLGDAQAILKKARKAKAAVVVGGGITALELVEGLRAQGLQVHYFMRGDRYWNNVLDEVESRIVEKKLAHDGVQIHFRTELAEVTGQRGQVNGVVTKDGRQIRCQLVAFAIGVQPRKELAQAAGLHCERGILADQYMRTSAEGIFAAGDVAQVYDPFSGKSVLDTLWNAAREQGSAAGANMTGRAVAYHKNVALNVTRLAGLTTTIIGTVGRGPDPSLPGIARGDSETWRQLDDHTVAETTQDVNRLRLLVGTDRLLGALVMGDQFLSVPLQELIGQRADISPIRDRLIHAPHLANTLLAFWTQWRSAHATPKP